jgi:hypothetical protein
MGVAGAGADGRATDRVRARVRRGATGGWTLATTTGARRTAGGAVASGGGWGRRCVMKLGAAWRVRGGEKCVIAGRSQEAWARGAPPSTVHGHRTPPAGRRRPPPAALGATSGSRERGAAAARYRHRRHPAGASPTAVKSQTASSSSGVPRRRPGRAGHRRSLGWAPSRCACLLDPAGLACLGGAWGAHRVLSVRAWGNQGGGPRPSALERLGPHAPDRQAGALEAPAGGAGDRGGAGVMGRLGPRPAASGGGGGGGGAGDTAAATDKPVLSRLGAASCMPRLHVMGWAPSPQCSCTHDHIGCGAGPKAGPKAAGPTAGAAQPGVLSRLGSKAAVDSSASSSSVSASATVAAPKTPKPARELEPSSGCAESLIPAQRLTVHWCAAVRTAKSPASVLSRLGDTSNLVRALTSACARRLLIHTPRMPLAEALAEVRRCCTVAAQGRSPSPEREGGGGDAEGGSEAAAAAAAQDDDPRSKRLRFLERKEKQGVANHAQLQVIPRATEAGPMPRQPAHADGLPPQPPPPPTVTQLSVLCRGAALRR